MWLFGVVDEKEGQRSTKHKVNKRREEFERREESSLTDVVGGIQPLSKVTNPPPLLNSLNN